MERIRAIFNNAIRCFRRKSNRSSYKKQHLRDYRGNGSITPDNSNRIYDKGIGKSFRIKDDVNIEDITMLTPHAMFLLGAAILRCHNVNLPCTITSIREHVEGRAHNTHKDGRAFDLSTVGWTNQNVIDFCKFINENYKGIAAISASDLKPRACVYHKIDGGAYHLHLQTRPFND